MRSGKERNISLPYTEQMKDSLEMTGASGCVAGMSITTYGIRVGIRTNKPEFLERLIAIIPPGWKPSSTPVVDRLFSLYVGTIGLRRNGRSYHKLYEDQQIKISSKDLEQVLELLEANVKLYIAEMARRRVFVHAGVVGWQGRAIIIPGRSMSGKTSLVAELVRAGATYYSDEYAVLDTRGRVHPYSTPLAVREPGSHKQRRCSVEELGGGVGVKPLPVGLIVVSRYESGKRFRPRPISSGQTMMALLANALPARRKPEAVMTTLREAVSGAVGLKSARGEAAETADSIFNYLREPQ